MYAFHLPRGIPHARTASLLVLILGGLLLVWAERAGDRPWRSLTWPRTARFWAVWGAVALSLPVALYLPGPASLLQIAPAGPGDWLAAAVLAGLSVAWRIPGARSRTARGKG